MFSRPVTDLIKMRISVRTYRDAPVDAESLQRIEGFLSSLSAGPFGTKPRFRLVTARSGDEAALKGLGTYGMIRRPAGFVVGALQEAERGLEDFGFLMESIVLMATDLGWGTCWLGGTFRKSRFADAIGVVPGESVPAVVSVGIPAASVGFRDRLIRRAAGSDKRMPWEQLFFSSASGESLAQTAAGAYAIPLEMVRLAPSASNKQPWRIVKAPDASVFHFCLQRTKGYDRSGSRIAETADLQRVDLGIAMCHFALTAQELKLAGAWESADPWPSILSGAAEYIATWRGR